MLALKRNKVASDVVGSRTRAFLVDQDCFRWFLRAMLGLDTDDVALGNLWNLGQIHARFLTERKDVRARALFAIILVIEPELHVHSTVVLDADAANSLCLFSEGWSTVLLLALLLVGRRSKRLETGDPGNQFADVSAKVPVIVLGV